MVVDENEDNFKSENEQISARRFACDWRSTQRYLKRDLNIDEENN
jgi:hypothetical protein